MTVSLTFSKGGIMKGKESLLGFRIRQFRKKRNLTIEKLAEKCGVHPTFIAQIEANKKEPSLATLRKISKALSVPVCSFFPSGKSPIYQDEVKLKELVEECYKRTPDEIELIIEIAKRVYSQIDRRR